MAKHMHGINLLPDKGDTVLVQFLNWALSVGRLLIIIVETLALGTFLYRFTLDWQIIDLKDKIKQQRAIVTSFKSQEDIFRNMQTRLDLIKKIDGLSAKNPQMLSDIVEMGRGYVTFRRLYVADKSVSIEVFASNPAPISAFVAALKEHPRIQSISIDKIENKTTSSVVTAGINASLKYDQKLMGIFGEPVKINEVNTDAMP